jgi:hypothetical protein
MSELQQMCLETGPGSYEVQDSLGRLSYKHYNPPRVAIARAKKTNKLFLSVELNKQFSGLESPGVNTYSPNHLKVLEKTPSAVFGTSKRNMTYLTPLMGRSPGPVYDSSLGYYPKAGVSFTKARRNSSLASYEPASPAPWDYNPQFPMTKVPVVIFRAAFDKVKQKTITPGPGSYNVSLSPKRVSGAYVSKIGRTVIESQKAPGPGTYDPETSLHSSSFKIGQGKRNIDPRICNFYLDAKPHELYRDY